jgi:hypothetical protein
MIIWGTKKVVRNLGYVADFCPICVGAKPFSLERVGMAGHLYYVSFGEGNLVGYHLNCLDCDVLLNGEPDRYSAFAKLFDNLPALIKETFPKLAEFHRNRLLLENKVRTALPTIDDDTRRSLLMEPFHLLSPKVTEHFASTHFEMGNTYMKRDILPVLADTLARLRPTEQEMDAVLTRLKQMRDVMGTRVKLADLMAELQQRHVETPANDTVFGTKEFSDPYAHDAKRVRPMRSRAGGAMRPHEKAARLMKILAFIGFGITAVAALIAVAGPIPPTSGGLMFDAGLLALSVLLFFTSVAVMRHENWGRIVGMVLGTLMLAGIPLGTIIGGYFLYLLGMGWDDYVPNRHTGS